MPLPSTRAEAQTLLDEQHRVRAALRNVIDAQTNIPPSFSVYPNDDTKVTITHPRLKPAPANLALKHGHFLIPLWCQVHDNSSFAVLRDALVRAGFDLFYVRSDTFTGYALRPPALLLSAARMAQLEEYLANLPVEEPDRS
jgi:hypothetical protein